MEEKYDNATTDNLAKRGSIMVTAQRQPRILIADSGIQFMAYSFSCESTLTRTAFIRASAQGPLRVVDCDAAGHYYYRASPDSAVEWVRPD